MPMTSAPQNGCYGQTVMSVVLKDGKVPYLYKGIGSESGRQPSFFTVKHILGYGKYIDFYKKILYNILLSPFTPFNTRQKRYNNLYMVKTLTSFEELGNSIGGIGNGNGLENPQIGGGGSGKKSAKENIVANQESFRIKRAKEIWGKMNPKDKQKISAQFAMLSGSAKKEAIYNWIGNQMDEAGSSFSHEKRVHQSVNDLIVELDEKTPTPRSAALRKLGYSRADLEPKEYTAEVIDQIVAMKIKKGDPIPLLEEIKKKNEEKEKRKLEPKQENNRVKELKNLGYTPENSEDISEADLNWALATGTPYGVSLPYRVSNAPAEIAAKIGTREQNLRESRELFEKMKTFDGSLEEAKKLIDEQYALYLEIEELNKDIHDWKVGKQKTRYEKTHKVAEPPINLPAEEQK